MEINRINAVNSAADKTFDFATKKPAPADSGNSSDKRGAKITKMDISKLENEMVTTDSTVTEDFLQKMIDKANKQLLGSGREFSYSVHQKTGQFMVKVIDRDTKEVIREIPPEKTLDAVAKMWDLMGIFVDDKT